MLSSPSFIRKLLEFNIVALCTTYASLEGTKSTTLRCLLLVQIRSRTWRAQLGLMVEPRHQVYGMSQNFLFSREAHWGEIDLYVSKHILARLKRREITKGSTNMSSWYRMVLQLPIEWTRSTMSSHMHIHRFTIWYICMMP